jgi:hypothetical protein
MTYLLMMIEKRRKEMFDLADKYGHTSEQTIACSQKLDELILLLMVMEYDKELPCNG